LSGIRRKIILNTLVIILVLTAVTSAIFIWTANTLVDTTMKNSLAPFARTAAKSVESNLHLLTDRLDLVAQNEVFRSYSPERIQGVLDHTFSGIEFTWLAAYTPEGRLFTGTAGSPRSISDMKLYGLIQETKNAVIGDTRKSDAGYEIAIGKPILADESIHLILVGSYKYDVLNDILGHIQIGQNCTAMVVSDGGVIVAHKDFDKITHRADSDEAYSGNAEMLGLIDTALTFATGSTILSHSGEDFITAYAPVRGANWSLILSVPKSEFMATARSAIYLNFAVVLLLIAVSLLIILGYSGKISKTLKLVTTRIKGLAEGDLTSSVEVIHTRDEAEMLSSSLKNTISDISGYISKLTLALEQLSSGNADIEVEGAFHGDFVVMKDALNQIIEYLNGILSHLKHSAYELTVSSRKVAERAHSVKNASEHQFEAISSLEREAEEISRGAVLIDQNAAETRRLMGEATDKLGCGREQMENTLEAMEALRRHAQEINTITKLMEDIAAQTNLLSLNAAVEAKRAGAAGAGFSVVAEEVRRLALQSSDSAKRAADIIEQTQKAINSGSEYAADTAQLISQVAEMTGRIYEIADTQAHSAKQTTEALGKANGDLGAIMSFAQDNLESSSDLAEASDEMAQKAESLAEMASRFKLRETVDTGDMIAGLKSEDILALDAFRLG
jgi:methyl-accepting chemotaxis protein